LIFFLMPRKARIDVAGAVHHLMVRGITRKSIFYDDTDKDRFIDRVEKVFTEGKTSCYAFALLSNHGHLLVRTGITPVTTLMRRLLTGYAVSFNKRHKRSGHLFQNRYTSILCEEEPYFLELVRYIHLNPLRARLVPDLLSLDSYPYSGHCALIGRYERSWLDTAYVLARFTERKEKARTLYRAFVEAGAREGKRTDLTGGGLLRSLKGWQPTGKLHERGDERILGSSGFVLNALKSAEETWERSQQLKLQGIDFTYVCIHVAGLFGLTPDEILLPGKYPLRVAARSVLCYFLVRELRMSTTQVAERLGIGQPAVSIAAKRGETIVREKGYGIP
jgi:putative transposase